MVTVKIFFKFVTYNNTDRKLLKVSQDSTVLIDFIASW